jgi:putative peptidoglycan lipid II flippase
MMVLVITKILGFLKIRIIAQLFGVSRELDIFWAAFAIPDTLFNVLVAGAINAAIIPMFSAVLHKDGDRPFNDLFKRLNFLYIIFFLVLSTLVYIYAPNIGEFLTRSRSLNSFLGTTSDITGSDIEMFTTLMRVMLLSPLFLGISSLVTGFLQVKKKFFVTSLAPLFYNIAMICVSLLFVRWMGMGVEGIAWSVVAGSLLHLLVQVPSLISSYKRTNTKFSASVRGFFEAVVNKKVVTVFKLALPRVIGLLGEQVNVIINTIISFTLSAGALSAYKFAFSLHLFPVQIFGGAISQIALPNLAEQHTKGDTKGFESTFNRAIHQALYLILPVVAILLILRLPLVRLAYGTGAFDWWATVVTSWCLALLSIAILGQAVVIIILRAFYAIHETKLPLIATAVAIVVNLVASYYLTNFFSHYFDWRPILGQVGTQLSHLNGVGLLEVLGSFVSDFATWSTTRNVSDAAVGGLALATSLSFVAEAVVAGWLLNRKMKIITYEKTIKPLIPQVINTVFMAIGMYFIYRLSDFNLDTTRTVAVITLTVVTITYGGISYIIGSIIFKMPEYILIVNRIQRVSAALLSRVNIGKRNGGV